MEQDSWRGAGWEDTTGSSPEQRGREWETKGILERWESWLSLGSLRSSQGVGGPARSDAARRGRRTEAEM